MFLVSSAPSTMTEWAVFLRKWEIRSETLTDPKEALERIAKVLLPVVLLRWPLRSRQEQVFLLRLRERSSWVPIVVLEESGQPRSRILALESGADFCLPADGAEIEFLAILGSFVRPSRRGLPDLFRLPPFSLDGKKRLLQRGEREVFLTPTEFAIVRYLFGHAGRLVLAAELAAQMPHRERAMPLPRLLHVHLANLRKKLGQSAMGIQLRAVRGRGLLLEWTPGRPSAE
ncbi:response regulator transcription factor [Methylacidimicrobium tartarophylax]|nr:winged helix-turn-helix domain-containing protein [Methylacidimicrobium tartarophylax]